LPWWVICNKLIDILGCEIPVLQSGLNEDSGLLGCDTVSLG
jgi:hypothetical protein